MRAALARRWSGRRSCLGGGGGAIAQAAAWELLRCHVCWQLLQGWLLLSLLSRQAAALAISRWVGPQPDRPAAVARPGVSV